MTCFLAHDSARQSGHTARVCVPFQQCLPLQQAEVLLPLQELHFPFGTCHHHLVSGFLFLVVLSEGRNVPSNFSLSRYITCYLGAAFDV